MSTIRTRATWFRSALLLGLVRGEEVVAWADMVIARDATHDPALAEVSLAAPGDLSALRHALLPLCNERESPEVAAALFDRVGHDFAAGRRSVTDTFALLRQARQMLAIPWEQAEAIRELGVENYLAASTPEGDTGAVAERLSAWLAQFDGAEVRLP